jgi:hypothetical protein
MLREPKRTPCIVLQFRSYEDPDTLRRRVEAVAIDPDTEHPVVSLPLAEMAKWLEQEGYRWRHLSNGVWDKAS